MGGPSLSTNQEPQSLALFEKPATAAFLVNWPYTWAQMAADKVSYRDRDVGWTFYPETVAGHPSRPPFGGIEIGVGKFTSHQKEAFAAVNCIRNAEHQLQYMIDSGNPSANTTAYSDPRVKKAFPMAGLIEQSLQRAAPRPQSQYYGDLSTALQESFSPPNSVSASTPKQAQDFILQVVKGEKLL